MMRGHWLALQWPKTTQNQKERHCVSSQTWLKAAPKAEDPITKATEKDTSKHDDDDDDEKSENDSKKTKKGHEKEKKKT